MLCREVLHNGVKKPLYPLLFHVKLPNYIAKMLLIKAKARPVCYRKLTPFCLKIIEEKGWS